MPESLDKEIRSDKPLSKKSAIAEEMDKEIRKDKPVHHMVEHVEMTRVEEPSVDTRPGANPFLRTNK